MIPIKDFMLIFSLHLARTKIFEAKIKMNVSGNIIHLEFGEH
jgi:hypothetical protein